MRRPPLSRALALAVTAACLLVPTGERASAGKEEASALAYRRTYEAAWLEARVRNVPIFVSRHKDG